MAAPILEKGGPIRTRVVYVALLLSEGSVDAGVNMGMFQYEAKYPDGFVAENKRKLI